MTHSRTSTPRGHLSAAIHELEQASDERLLGILAAAYEARRALDIACVSAVAEALIRSGGFAHRNRISMTTKISDELAVDRAEARRFVIAATQLSMDVTANGTTIPPRLPATADGFAAGRLGLQHVLVIVTLLQSRPAERLSQSAWTSIESQLAAQAGEVTPAQLRSWGRRHLLQAMPEPDESDRVRSRKETNELTIRPHLDRPGGTITALLDDAEMFSTITRVIDSQALLQPRAACTTIAQRRARVLSNVCAEALRRRSPRHRDGSGARPDLTRDNRSVTCCWRGADLQVRGWLSGGLVTKNGG